MDSGSLRVLLTPGRFFEERMQDEPGLKTPALIVLIIGLIGAFSTALVTNMTTAMLPAEAQTIGMVIVAVVAVTAIIMAYLTWFAVSIIFYLISMLFKGEGSFKRTLEVTGYGYLPQVFGGMIGAVISYLIIANLAIPATTNPEQIAEVASLIATDPLLQIAGIAGILFLIWSANIWIFGMKYARNLSTRDAVLTVGIPVGLYIVCDLIALVGWL
jgi:hypothetical protein